MTISNRGKERVLGALDPYDVFVAMMSEVYSSSDSVRTFFIPADLLSATVINPRITAWREGRIPDSVLLGVLGHPYITAREFDYYVVEVPVAKGPTLPSDSPRPRFPRTKEGIIKFENKMTAILIWSILDRIGKTTNPDDLATSLMALYLVSDNQRESLSRNKLLLDRRKQEAAFLAFPRRSRLEQQLRIVESYDYFFVEDYIRSYREEQKRQGEDPGETDRRLQILSDIFFNHFDAYDLGNESGRPVNPRLMAAFFGILQDNRWLHSKLLDNFRGDPARLDRFVRKYFDGLMAVAQKVMDHEHNGIVYISDHLERILQQAGRWPKNTDVWDEQKWREELLSQTDNGRLFKFLAPEEKVREIVGRYDYRALIDYLRTLKREGSFPLKILACGFGELGVASYELAQKIAAEISLDTEVIPADIMVLNPNITPDSVGVTEYCRTEGIVARQNLPDRRGISVPYAKTREWALEEKEAAIDWRKGVLPRDRQVDLTASSPLSLDEEQAELVTCREQFLVSVI